MLWGERAEPQARASLRQALSALRRTLDYLRGPDLVTTVDSIMLTGDGIAVDALEVERRIDIGTRDALSDLMHLYRGPLLTGYDGLDAAFDDWLLFERAARQRSAMAALHRLTELHEQAGDVELALAVAERICVRDPASMFGHHVAIRLCLDKGDRVRAVRLYESHRRVLRRDFGLEPDPQTSALLLSAGRSMSFGSTSARPRETLLLSARSPAMGGRTMHGAPSELGRPPASFTRAFRAYASTEFQDGEPRLVGRLSEMAQVEAVLDICVKQSRGRIIVIRGVPGIGKSHFAQACLGRAKDRGFSVHTIKGRSVRGRRDLMRAFERSLFELSRDRRRKATCDLVSQAAARCPMALLIEDVHALSPDALDTVEEIAACAADQRLAVLVTTRVRWDPISPRWRTKAPGFAWTTIDLGPLVADECRELADGLLADRDESLDKASLRDCFERSGGHPGRLEALLLDDRLAASPMIREPSSTAARP